MKAATQTHFPKFSTSKKMNELLVKSKVTTGVENERTTDPSPEAWHASHHQFRDCFAWRETWAQLFDYWREMRISRG
jgi:hypothetical protein